MDDLIGSGIVKLIPWIIPILLVASWLANTKTTAASGKAEKSAKSEKTEKSEKTAKAQKSQASVPVKTSTPAVGESLDVGISDKDMTE